MWRLLVMIPFGIWDWYFVKRQYWGFNSDYLTGASLFSLPIEEILFFIVVPYASLFAFYAIRFHFPKYKLSAAPGLWITLFLILFALSISLINIHRIYTVINFLVFASVLILGISAARQLLFSFYAV